MSRTFLVYSYDTLDRSAGFSQDMKITFAKFYSETDLQQSRADLNAALGDDRIIVSVTVPVDDPVRLADLVQNGCSAVSKRERTRG